MTRALPAQVGPATTAGPASAAAEGPDPRRWLALVFVALAQLMIALDATILNVALPSTQHSLHFSDTDRQWV
ncbi:MAG: Transrane efflux protein, partial [Jatrophihabitans sp.]|nr:Transrane efflux protein [Jatrophihabitans sp.]